MTETDTTPTVSTTPLLLRINRKRELSARINQINRDLFNLSNAEMRLTGQLREVRDSLAGISNEAYLKAYPSERAKKETQENRSAQIKAELEENRRRKGELMEKHQHLVDVELPQCDQETSMAEVIAYQDSLKELKTEAKRLEDASAAQSKIMAEQEATVVPMKDRGAQRTEILANIAIGEASQGDLEELERVVNQERQAHKESLAKAKPIMLQAAETIGALEIKLAAIRQKIAVQERDTPRILEQYLMTEILRVGTQYVSSALAVKGAYLQFHALEALLEGATGTKRRLLPAWLNLPLPKLEECQALAMRGNSDLIFSSQAIGFGESDLQTWVKSERERLRGMGCELL